MKTTQHIVMITLGMIPLCKAATVSASSNEWIVMAGNYDFLADQQTGSPASDIVGSGVNHGLFVTFNDNGNTSKTDGFWGFRLRLDAAGGTKNSPAFDRVAWIGIDADLSGSIDVFLGLNLHGSNREIGIHAPGTGANNSPSSTSITATPAVVYGLTTDNYNHRPVDYLTDGGDTNDVTTATIDDPDYYVSFMVPFADVVGFLAGRPEPVAIDDESPLRFVVATSTQTNSLNQDLGAINGGVNSSVTWEQLGGFTPTISTSGQPVPEPASGMMAVGALALSVLRRRR